MKGCLWLAGAKEFKHTIKAPLHIIFLSYICNTLPHHVSRNAPFINDINTDWWYVCNRKFMGYLINFDFLEFTKHFFLVCLSGRSSNPEYQQFSSFKNGIVWFSFFFSFLFFSFFFFWSLIQQISFVIFPFERSNLYAMFVFLKTNSCLLYGQFQANIDMGTKWKNVYISTTTACNATNFCIKWKGLTCSFI